ncbi:hypothetical protein, partial [Xanthomonas bonasiae]|uniref:hypothetical protein n=1 Tax=Xanthomonas bonasiae TaxID=2810351 RepID=UPI00197CBB0F
LRAPGPRIGRDSRKGHPAPAANGAHPCAPPFGFFPGPSAAAEGNPESQKATAQQQQSNSQSQSNRQSDSNSNSNNEEQQLERCGDWSE